MNVLYELNGVAKITEDSVLFHDGKSFKLRELGKAEYKDSSKGWFYAGMAFMIFGMIFPPLIVSSLLTFGYYIFGKNQYITIYSKSGGKVHEMKFNLWKNDSLEKFTLELNGILCK